MKDTHAGGIVERGLAKSNRILKERLARQKAAETTLDSQKVQSSKLLEQSRHLQKHLQDRVRQILSSQESARKAMTLKLQDEVTQTLVGIQIQLLALKKEVSVSHAAFQKEIATTAEMVQKLFEIINRCASESHNRNKR